MKKHILFSFLFFQVAVGNGELPATAFLVDSVKAVVFGQEEPHIITNSDVLRPNLSGEYRGIDDLIFERLVYGDAQKFKIMGDEDTVDKYLEAIQKQNNLTDADLRNVFISAGYSYEEGREQLKMLQAVNSMLDFKIRTKVVVPRKAVEEYYQEHPVVAEAKVVTQRGFVPYAEGKEEKQKKALAYMAQTGKEMRGIQWGEPFSISESEVAADKAFLFALKKGEISHAKDIGIGFEVFRVQETSPRMEATLEERYKEIADALRKPIFDELLSNYKQSLMDSAAVLYLEPITGASEE